MRYSKKDIKSLGTILGIWAHPDDESWSMAGLMAVARQYNQRVVCVTATSGEAGKYNDNTDHAGLDLTTIRKAELINALKCLDVTEHEWLGYQDGHMATANSVDAVDTIANIIERIQPNSIFTFELEGITGHPDHKSIAQWTCAAVEQLGIVTPVYGAVELKEKYESFGKKLDEKFDVYFMTDIPVLVTRDDAAIYYELPEDILDIKIACLQAQPSQTAMMFVEPDMAIYIREIAKSEHFIQLR